jgi:hypothetical protein
MQFGPFNFSYIRILIAAAIIRTVLRREFVASPLNGLDKLIVLWGLWAVSSGFFYDDFSGALVNRLGLVYNAWGIYLLFRCLCRGVSELKDILCLVSVLLIPVAASMLYENITGVNLFAVVGQPELSGLRLPGFRAKGSFAHAILAGTAGAVCLPLMLSIWRKSWKLASLGMGACMTMMMASVSSGPWVSGLAGVGFLLLWPLRSRMGQVVFMTIVVYLILEIVMEAPVYHLIGGMDLTGTSSSWHRVELIDAAIRHLGEWWIAGTDYTAHWVPVYHDYRLSNPRHTDITNHYIRMGVTGGLPLLILFAAVLIKGFLLLRTTLILEAKRVPSDEVVVWAVGASLCAHVASMVGVSYFDQTSVLLYMILASIGGMYSDRINHGGIDTGKDSQK